MIIPKSPYSYLTIQLNLILIKSYCRLHFFLELNGSFHDSIFQNLHVSVEFIHSKCKPRNPVSVPLFILLAVRNKRPLNYTIICRWGAEQSRAERNGWDTMGWVGIGSRDGKGLTAVWAI